MMRRALALALLLAAAPVQAAQTRAFVLTSDFSTGGLSVVDLDTRAVNRDVATIHGDATARWHDGLLYVVNRYGQDNVQVIDPAAGYATVRQFSVGAGSNPQDIAFGAPGRAYVSRLGDPDLLIVNPATGAALGAVPLGGLADADGNPEAARMAQVGPYLFVALQRLANFQPTDTSLVAVVDTRTDTLVDVDLATPGVQAVVLAGTNPVTDLVWDAAGARLLVGCAGSYGVNDGGIEAIPVDLAAAVPVPPRSAGEVIGGAALGGDVLDFAWNGAGHHHYALVGDAAYDTRLLAWSDSTGAVTDTLLDPGGFFLADLALDERGELYVASNSFAAPGVRVYRAGADTLLAGPLDTGLPPQQIVFDDVAAPPPPAPPGLALAPPAPNPAHATARIALDLPRAAAVEVEVLDVAGRRVRDLARGPAAAGTLTLAWDLADRHGNAVRSGLYLVRARALGRELVRRLVVAR